MDNNTPVHTKCSIEVHPIPRPKSNQESETIENTRIRLLQSTTPKTKSMTNLMETPTEKTIVNDDDKDIHVHANNDINMHDMKKISDMDMMNDVTKKNIMNNDNIKTPSITMTRVDTSDASEDTMSSHTPRSVDTIDSFDSLLSPSPSLTPSVEENDSEEDDLLSNSLTPLPRSELLPFLDESHEDILLSITTYFNQESWYTQYQGIEIARRVLVHHRLWTLEYKMENIIQQIISACCNNRSVMAKNGLLGLLDLIDFGNSAITSVQLKEVLAILMTRACCEKRFLKTTAEEGLDRLAFMIPSFVCIEQLLMYSKDKNPKSCAMAAKICSKILIQMKLNHEACDMKLEFTKSQVKGIVLGMGAFRIGKLQETRLAARKMLKTVRLVLGPTEFDLSTREHVDLHTANVMIAESKSSSSSSRGSKNTRTSRLSLRDVIRKNRSKAGEDSEELNQVQALKNDS